MRGALKRILESTLLHGGAAAVGRKRHARRALVLAYHNVVDDAHSGLGEASLHVPLSAFRAQLDALEDLAAVVALDDVLPPSNDGADEAERPDRPRVAVTFDDAYRGAVALGLPELGARGMPATVFVSPGRLGGHAFWWDRYAAEATTGAGDFRDVALTRLGGRDERVDEWAKRRGLGPATLPDQLRVAAEDELSAATTAADVTLASHGWSHANLARLEDADLEEELARPLRWLGSRFAAARPWLAYPYGRTDPRVARAAAEAGYDAAFRIEGGWIPTGSSDPMLLPRLNVPAGLSEAGFRLRLSGLLCG